MKDQESEGIILILKIIGSIATVLLGVGVIGSIIGIIITVIGSIF